MLTCITSACTTFHFSMIQLVINADDFGYNKERNNGILECFKHNSVSSTSILANGICSEDDLEEALKIGLPIGLHFNITEGNPISDKNEIQSLLNDHGQFVGKSNIINTIEGKYMKQRDVEIELINQIKWFRNKVGKSPIHIDGHNHVHVFPIIRDAFAKVLKEYNIKWTRCPTDHSYPQEFFLQYVVRHAEIASEIFKYHNINFPKFIGLSTMGKYMSVESIEMNLKKQISNGEENVLIELMTHPGYPCTSSTGGCGNGPDDFSKSVDRKHEMEILQSNELHSLFKKYHIKMSSFE